MRILALLMFALVLFATGCQKDTGGDPKAGPPSGNLVTKGPWKEFSSTMFEFQVSFPWGNPTNRPFHGDAPRGLNQPETFSAKKFDKDGITHQFAIATGLRTKAGIKQNQLLEEAMYGLVRQAAIPEGTKPLEPKQVTWGGKPATETVYETTGAAGNKKVRYVIRQLATDTVAYVGIIRQPGDVTAQEESKFFDSFKIVPKAGKK